MRDSVDGALAAVPFDYSARQPDGEQLPQSSAPEIIVAVLRLLGVRPSMRVLEVGTGSGSSSALLANLVGSTGRVVSLDVDAALVARAADLLARAGCAQVTVVAADGRAAYPAAAPYDRLVAWATADWVPVPWVEQLCESGRLLTAWIPDTGTAFGCSRPGSMALLSVRTAHYVEAGERAAAETRWRWVARWRAVGRPGFDQVQLRTERQAHAWCVRATMPTGQNQG